MKILLMLLPVMVIAILTLAKSSCQVESFLMYNADPDFCEKYGDRLINVCGMSVEEATHYVGLEECNSGWCPIEKLNYAQEHWTEWEGWSETNYCHLYAYLLYVPEPDGCGISDNNVIMDYVKAGCDADRVKV